MSHYELVLVGGRFWRMTSLCERAKWKTAPRGDDPAAIARRLSVVMRCCGRGPMPRLPIRTMAEVEKSVGRRSVSAAMRARVISRDGLLCGICGRPVDPAEVHIDHRLPVAKGGDSHPQNLQVAHRACNLWKGTKTWDEMQK